MSDDTQHTESMTGVELAASALGWPFEMVEDDDHVDVGVGESSQAWLQSSRAPAARGKKSPRATDPASRAMDASGPTEPTSAAQRRLMQLLSEAMADRPHAQPKAASSAGIHLRGQRGRVSYLGFDNPRYGVETSIGRDDCGPSLSLSLVAFAQGDDYVGRWNLQRRQLTSLPWSDPDLFAQGRSDGPARLLRAQANSRGAWAMAFEHTRAGACTPPRIDFVSCDEYEASLPFAELSPEAEPSPQAQSFVDMSTSGDGLWLAAHFEVRWPNSPPPPTKPPLQVVPTPGKVVDLAARRRRCQLARPVAAIALHRLEDTEGHYEPLFQLQFADRVELARLDVQGRRLYVATDSQLRCFDLANLHAVFDPLEPGSVAIDATPAANHGHGPTLEPDFRVVADADWLAEELELLTPSGPAWSLELPGGLAAHALAASPGGRRVCVGLADGSCLLIDTFSARIEQRLGVHDTGAAAITCVAFDGDTRWLATGNARGEIVVYALASGRSVLVHTPSDSRVSSLAFDNEGERICAGNDAGQIWVGSLPAN